MKLTLGFSPCPNDTFIFDALVNKKIDTGNIDFEVVLDDVETLNKWAVEGKLDITKLSCAVLPYALPLYAILNSGSALGSGVGPLLISNGSENINTADVALISQQTIAIPGAYTTANMLFSMAYPDAKNKIYLRYDEIESFVLSGKGLGVIIHENRFTYADKGLIKIIDLGDFWETKTKHSIPLGSIVIKRTFDESTQQMVDALIRKSLAYSFENHYPVLSGYIKKHAQEMEEETMRKHIDLYVNEYSIDLGVNGKNAIVELLDNFYNIHPEILRTNELLFVHEV